MRADGTQVGCKDRGHYTLEQFVCHVFGVAGNRFVTDVRKSALLTILDCVKASGRLRTCNVLLANLKQISEIAVTRDIGDRSPMGSVMCRHASGTEVLPERVLSVEEITRLAALLHRASLSRNGQAAIWLMLKTGVRIGELMGAV